VNILAFQKSVKMGTPKNKIDRVKILEEKRQKQKELQEKFLQKNKEIIVNTPKNEIKDQPKLININKFNMDKDSKEQLRNLNKKLEELREKDKKQKDIIFKLKTQVKSTNEELMIEKENNIKLSSKIETYFSKINQLESEITKLNESYSKEKIEELEQSIIGRNIIIENKNSKIMELKTHITKLDDAIKDYREQIFNLKHGEDISIRDKKYYHKIITSYAQTNAKLNQKLLEVEQEYKEKIDKLVNSDLVVTQLKRQVNEARIRKFANSNNIKNTLGYLKTINNFVFFESIDKEKYIANIDRIDFSEMASCRATIINNIARITRLYDNENVFINELKDIKYSKKIKEEKRSFAYENINYENHYNVLMVGSEGKREYISMLKRVGINVTWYDSYEGNVVRLKNMLDRHDIIICCKRHSRHYATNLMTYMQEHDKKNSIKYNIIDKDNVENIIARVRYCIENM
jgi:hypothetical protein